MRAYIHVTNNNSLRAYTHVTNNKGMRAYIHVRNSNSMRAYIHVTDYVYHKALNDGRHNNVIRITIFATFDIKSIYTLKYNEYLSKSPNSEE